MKQTWISVRGTLGMAPLVEGMLGGKTPLYAERYLHRRKEIHKIDTGSLCLISKLGGAASHGGEPGRWAIKALPMQSALVPANSMGRWRYTGAGDFVIFYFADAGSEMTQRFLALAGRQNLPLLFTDTLVSACALRIVDELKRGQAADAAYLSLLAETMLEQAWRTLSSALEPGIRSQHVHAARLQAVLAHIREHLADELTVDILAVVAGMSASHFRHIFRQSTGVAPHRYVLGARLEEACKLLKMSTLPLSQIADECGFSSQSHMTAKFREAYAATPAEFRRDQGKGWRAGV